MITKKELEVLRKDSLGHKITIAKNKASAILEGAEKKMRDDPNSGKVLVCLAGTETSMSDGIPKTHPWFYVMESLTEAGFSPAISSHDKAGRREAGWKIEVEW